MSETASPVTLVLNTVYNIELSAVAGTLKRLDIPVNARSIVLTPRSVDCKVVIGGTDAAAIGSSAYESLFANTTNTVDVPGTQGGKTRNVDSSVAASNSRRICLAGPASAVIEVVVLSEKAIQSNTANSSAAFGVPSTATDALANPATDSQRSLDYVFNGSTWDRARSGIVTGSATLTGHQNILSEGVYNSTPVTITDGQGIVKQLDARGNTKVAINDGANQVTVVTSGADAVSNTGNRLGVSSWMKGYNGSTWDRIRTGQSTPTATLTGLQNVLPEAIYNATPTVRTEGQAGPFQADANGNLLVSQATKIAGEDQTNDVMKVEHQFSATHITTATTTTVKSGGGLLHAIIIGKGVATGVITVYDNTAGSGTVLSAITFGAALLTDPPLLATYDIRFVTGLTIVTSQATALTIVWR